MNIRQIIEKYKETNYKDELCAIIYARKATYLKKDAERYVSSTRLGNRLYELIGELVDFVAELTGIDISEDIQARIADNVFTEFENIFRDNVNHMTFDDDTTRELLKKIVIYLNFSFIYNLNDKITDVTLTKAVPPIIDYNTVCISVKADTNPQTVRKIKQILGTQTETLRTPSEVIIKGFYHYTQGFRQIEQCIREGMLK